jgi:hypothetical protein
MCEVTSNSETENEKNSHPATNKSVKVVYFTDPICPLVGA